MKVLSLVRNYIYITKWSVAALEITRWLQDDKISISKENVAFEAKGAEEWHNWYFITGMIYWRRYCH